MKTSVKPGKVNSLVVCSRSGDDGCKANCNHRTPHVEHEPYQTDCDDYNPCSMAGWCDDVCGKVRCLPHNVRCEPPREGYGHEENAMAGGGSTPWLAIK